MKVRIDKWIWAVRIFKSRSKAADACRSNHVKINDKSVKPAYLVEEGQEITIKKDGFSLVFKVVKLIDKRVGFPIAVTCYENLTSEEELHKFDDWFVGKSNSERREKGSGRPTKRDRRKIEQFKDIF